MLKIKKTVFVLTILGLMSGCESVNNGLHQVNVGLSKFTGQDVSSGNNSGSATEVKKQIKNQWNVTDAQAMAYLASDDSDWNDHGKLKGVDWYKFWSQQIHYRTDLNKKADKYCDTNTWDTRHTGANCKEFYNAMQYTRANEMQELIKERNE